MNAVSIPTGSIKIKQTTFSAAPNLVSIPTGSIKIKELVKFLTDRGKVSIPTGSIKMPGAAPQKSILWSFNSNWFD